MKSRLSVLLACIGLAAVTQLAIAGPAVAPPIKFGRFGEVAVYQPAGTPGGVAILVSGERGWNAASDAHAAALVARGAVVIGVSLPRYHEGFASKHGLCALLGADFESLSHSLQRQLQLADYHVPVLISEQQGATLVRGAFATAPFDTFAGAVALQPAELAGFPCAAQANNQMAPGLQRAKIVTLNGAAAEGLAGAYAQIVAQNQPPKIAAPQISDLPLTLVPATGSQNATLALLMTGDGGWAGIDQEVSRVLAARGVPVVGFNTLKYFWQQRTPQEVAAAVTRVLRHYMDDWHRDRLVLIGYSFGADVMPFVISRLAPDLRQRITSVSLLGLSEYASFEVHVADWLPGVSSKDSPVLPELAKLRDLRVLCVYGEGEKDTLCPRISSNGIRALRVGTGHHFGGNYDEIADAILQTR